MSETVTCVRHQDGWCACVGTTIKYKDQIKTLCNHCVILLGGLEYRVPDCPECLEILRWRTNNENL